MNADEVIKSLENVERPVILLEGRRSLPDSEHGKLVAVAHWLCERYPKAVFRSGNAEGSDYVFAQAVAGIDAGRMELVLPHEGMGRKRRPVGARCVSLDDVPEAELVRLVENARKIGRDEGRIADYYLQNRGKAANAAMSKATYLLRDTLKVLGSESVGLAPATAGLFWVDVTDPRGGGTGYTIKTCELQRVP